MDGKHAGIIVIAMAAAWPATAGATSHTHEAHRAQAAAPAPLSAGEVRKIDLDAQKITIRHGPLENLGMPPMTMVFRVSDSAMLGQVKAGDNVRFRAEKRDGAYTVTRIERE